ncbi:MAG: salicylate synthase [Pseudonocardiaceae bacterium]
MVTSTLFRRHYDEIDLPRSADPLLAAARLVESGLSDTHVLYERGGRWSLALGALAEITLDRSEVVLRTATGTRHAVAWREAPLDRVAELLDGLPAVEWRAYGWAGFELAYACAGLDLVIDDTLLHLIIPRVEVQLDAERTVVRSTDAAALHRVCELLTAPLVPRVYQPSPVDVESIGCDDYRNAVAAAVREIRDRRMQKVILSRVVPVGYSVDLVGSYVVGRRRNTPSRSFLLDVGGVRAAGFSPEIVVQVDENGRVRTQPLAGTRAMASCAEEDQRLRTDLLHDTKEIFEHAVSVKASWDELAELCEPGSVVVDDFMTIKQRGTVQHLASSVSGQLAPGHGPWQAFAALFPAVTASGVPKKAAYGCIRRHERQVRGLYSGAVLAVDHNGALDAALVLRTIFQQDGKTWLRAGAGIVEQSRPEREFEETCEKLRSVALHLVAQDSP